MTIVPSWDRALPAVHGKATAVGSPASVASTRLRDTRSPLPEVQPPPHLAVPFADEGRSGQVVPNQIEKICIRHQRLGTAFARHDPLGRLCDPLLTIVERRASLLPHVAHPLHPVGGPGGCGDRLAHFDDLRLAKGPGFLTRCHNSSFCIVSSPMRLIAASQLRLDRIALPLLERGVDPRNAFSRHFSSRYISIPSSRDNASTARLATSAAPLPACGLRSSAAPGPNLRSGTLPLSSWNHLSSPRSPWSRVKYPKFVSKKTGAAAGHHRRG